MTRINLLPDSYFAARRARRTGMLCTGAGLAVLLAIALGWWLSESRIDALSYEIAQAENQLRVQETQQGAAARLEAEGVALRGILAIRKKIEVPLPVSAALVLPCNMVPPSIVLTRASVEVSSPPEAGRAVQGAGRGGREEAAGIVAQPLRLELEGLAVSDLEVARFVSTVSNHGLIRNVKLTKSRNVSVGGVSRTYFVLDLQIPLDAEFVPRGQKGDQP